MTQEQTLIEAPPRLELDDLVRLERVLKILDLVDLNEAPAEMANYLQRSYLEATPVCVVRRLFEVYTQPPPEPKRPRLTAPVRRGLQQLVAGIDTGTSSDDVLRAAKWIAEECGHE